MPLFSSKAREAGYDDRYSTYSTSEYEQPPSYKHAMGGHSSHHSRASARPRPTDRFLPSNELQLQALGYDTMQAWSGNMLENVEVFSVKTGDLKYVSIRLKKSSNSCALVRGSDRHQRPLIATIYRWGPGRPPRLRILPPDTSATVESAINNDRVRAETVEVKNAATVFSRATKFETSLGTFEWRFGDSAEKRAYNADSLLICERTDRVPSAAGGLRSKHGVRVAHLIRNDQFRTPGTVRYSGGNGGRLEVDLSIWGREQRDVEAFIVSSCICMLKKEADRFKENNIALLT